MDIQIYDLAGNLVKNMQNSKSSKVVWDGNAENGSPLTPGIYIAIIEIDGQFMKRKLMKK